MLNKKRLSAFALVVVVILLIPFIAMFYTNEVQWDGLDFIVAAVLLFGTAILCEITLSKLPKKTHRILVCGVILLITAIIWAELAVGIFGSIFSGS